MKTCIEKLVYNPLNKFIGRARHLMKKLESNVGVLMASISVSFSIFFFGIVQDGKFRTFLCAVGFALLIFTAWYYRDMQTKMDEAEKE